MNGTPPNAARFWLVIGVLSCCVAYSFFLWFSMPRDVARFDAAETDVTASYVPEGKSRVMLVMPDGASRRYPCDVMLCAFLKDRPPTPLSVRLVKPNPWVGEIIVSARAGSKAIIGPTTGNLIYESTRNDVLLASIFLLFLDIALIAVNGRYERDGKAKLRAQ